MFNQNLKGVFYLAGVLLTCFINSLVVRFVTGPNAAASEEVCNMIEGLDMPMGQTILGFTFAYLFYIISKYKMWSTNGFTLVIFPLLIISDMIWNLKNSCAGGSALALSLAMGVGLGYCWGMIIHKVDPELQFFNGISNKSVCSRPNKMTYRCRLKAV
jgi:hypothetical protein